MSPERNDIKDFAKRKVLKEKKESLIRMVADISPGQEKTIHSYWSGRQRNIPLPSGQELIPVSPKEYLGMIFELMEFYGFKSGQITHMNPTERVTITESKSTQEAALTLIRNKIIHPDESFTEHFIISRKGFKPGPTSIARSPA